jgi:hypothetical protein
MRKFKKKTLWGGGWQPIKFVCVLFIIDFNAVNADFQAAYLQKFINLSHKILIPLKMKKIIVMATALAVLTACKKDNETTVESDSTIIETPNDTVTVDVDTLSEDETETDAEAMPANETETTAATGKTEKVQTKYAAFGDKIVADNALTREQMLKKYNTLKPGDTVNVKFKSTIKNVCQKKGCWMTLDMPTGKESFVRFKDYGFFVPLNAGSREAIVNGKAFVSEISVAELKHYAKDEGKSQAEIDKITQPKLTYGFEANGVLITQ